ncbi:MotA/TolQ/ExbB proton channel family protein [Acetonema longum]|uniref:MotA/TolQ/ExbB proton channel n=1 Tax=Acetonema longum DSM 6540 TaxID=1009370 RepID=F7NPV0_9FIRM|nr:MotA/TolQ/ExbB proton channel family protein [Acetonema longum]EGO61941.1 MotA/TolQ/ExbB proton channel [Acetonema longum DSM 6540]
MRKLNLGSLYLGKLNWKKLNWRELNRLQRCGILAFAALIVTGIVFTDFFIQIFTVFHKGGLVMYPLLLCSILTVAIAVERYYPYKRASDDGAVFRKALATLVMAEQWEQAAELCRSDSSAGAYIAKTAISLRHSRHLVEGSLEKVAAQQAAKLRERLSYLETIVTMSPLLGLLGTVVGMIQSFSVMNIREGQPYAITGGVGEALIATATGLCVAILALVVHTVYQQWLDQVITDMEETGWLVLEALQREGSE